MRGTHMWYAKRACRWAGWGLQWADWYGTFGLVETEALMFIHCHSYRYAVLQGWSFRRIGRRFFIHTRHRDITIGW